MNELTKLINEVIKINDNDDLYIDKKSLFTKVLTENNMYRGIKEKIFIFTTELIKFENKKILKNQKKIDKNVSDMFFKHIKKTELEHMKNFSALFLNFYMFGKLTIDELEKCLDILAKLDIYYFSRVWSIKRDGKKSFNKEYGEVLENNGFAEHIFKIGNIEYSLKPIGEKLFENVYLDITSKEKAFYSQIVDLEMMETSMTAEEHKQYYESVFKRIKKAEAYIKTLRVHEGIFKEFIEEYDVLIKYTISKYGKDQKMRFCGKETQKLKQGTIKYDGVIINTDSEQRIEITYPLFSEDENNKMKQLNNFGRTEVQTIDCRTYKNKIKSIIRDKIKEKNDSDSYDETVSLVVMLDMYDYAFDEEIENEQYYEELFKDLKEKEYKFKSVEVLITGIRKDSQPWIYKIK